MVVTLCGSARFETEFKEWNKRLSLAGHVVLTLACYPSDNGGKDWYTARQKDILDSVHLAKIDLSEAIVVINVDGYIGESTKREILHAMSLKKQLYRIYPYFACGFGGSLFRDVCPYIGCSDPLQKRPCTLCYE